jgi:hypothetical protein
MPEISIIYVNWNSENEIMDSIDSIHKHCMGTSFEIIVVDNASLEGVEKLSAMDITLLKNTQNRGFAAGCNKGAKHARGNFLLFLNPDTILMNNILEKMSNFLTRNQDVGAAGPMIFDLDEKIHYGAGRTFPSLTNEFLEHTTLTFKFPKNKLLGAPYYSYWDHKSTRQVDALLGACMMFKTDIFIRLKGFDEKFFLYYEETDLCRRTSELGLKVFYLHDCHLLHKEKQSTKKLYGNIDNMVFQYFESAFIYFKKHKGRLYAELWRKMIVIIYLLRYARKKKPIFLNYAMWGLKKHLTR